jgi:hypothetical protein
MTVRLNRIEGRSTQYSNTVANAKVTGNPTRIASSDAPPCPLKRT